jgi:WD40 repeat protein
MMALEGHTGDIRCLAYSPDGNTLASGSYDKTAILWDLQQRRPRATLAKHDDSVFALAFSPDGRTLATAAGKVVRLWNVRDGKLRSTIDWPSTQILALAFSPDGSVLAGTSDTSLVSCNLIARQTEAKLLGQHTDQAWWLTFSPNGQRLASAGSSGEVILWDLATDQKRLIRKCRHGVRELTYFPDSRTLALTVNHCVRLRDAVTLREKGSFKGHRDCVMSVAVSPDGQTLISGSWDKTVRIWDTATRRERATLDWGINSVLTVACSPDGMTAAAAGGSPNVIVWDVA